MTRSSAPSSRRVRAHESFQTAAECIGPIAPHMALFAITRGQFSMVDAVLHVLDQLGPSRLTIWTWTIAAYEIDQFVALQHDRRVVDGLLVIDGGARTKNRDIIAHWHESFGATSVRYVRNHAKIATVHNAQFKVLLRGSMNLNFNPRFEQLDVTEGGPDFDLVQEIEHSLPVLSPSAGDDAVYAASKLGDAFDRATLDMFRGLKVWAK